MRTTIQRGEARVDRAMTSFGDQAHAFHDALAELGKLKDQLQEENIYLREQVDFEHEHVRKRLITDII